MDLAEVMCENKKNWNSVVFDICSLSWVERLKNHINANSNNNVDANAVGSDCSVCFEEMKSDEKLVKCITTCKNYFHDNCISMWLSTGHDNCPLCRGKWIQNDNNELVVNILTPVVLEQVSVSVSEPSQLSEPELEPASVSEPSQLSEPELEPASVSEPVLEKLYKVNKTAYNYYTIEEECTIKGFCNKIGIKLSKYDVYYEFIKPQIIEFYRKLIIVNKITNDMFIGDDTIKLAKTNQKEYNIDSEGFHVCKIIKPNSDIPYKVFIHAYTGQKKLYKNQLIIYQSKNMLATSQDNNIHNIIDD
jgi:hypothetical protein